VGCGGLRWVAAVVVGFWSIPVVVGYGDCIF
jgi:hypothetical protein